MVNKKGYLRIVEAIIAILIVLGAVLIAINKNEIQTGSDFCNEMQNYLDEIGNDNSLRTAVIQNKPEEVENFLKNRIKNPLINYEVKICNPDELCILDKSGLDNVEVCAGERLISTTPESSNYNPKKLKIFLFGA